MGNVRISYFNNGSGAEVLEENNYYPFGLKHEGYNALAGNPTYNYKYNGKELQQESGMYDYGARFYMPDIGRWGVIDEKAEKYRRWTPYAYAIDNPILFIDPDGRDIVITITDENGKTHKFDYVAGSSYNGSNKFIQNFYKAVATLKEKGADDVINKLENSKEEISIVQGKTGSYFKPSKNEILWNDTQGILTENGTSLTPTLLLDHEGKHALNKITDPSKHSADSEKDENNPYDNKEEETTIKEREQDTAKKLGLTKEGETTRVDHHNGTFYNASDVNQQAPNRTTQQVKKTPNKSKKNEQPR